MRIARRSFLRASTAAGASLALASNSLNAEPPSLSGEERKRRYNRTTETVARQLAAIYGQKLQSLSYIPSTAVIGRLRLAQLTGDKQTERHCLELVDGLARQIDKRDIKNGPEAAGLLVFAEVAPHASHEAAARNLSILRRVADTAIDESGSPRRFMSGHNEMSDSVFMSCPLLAAFGKLTGESRYFDACENHFDFMRSLCEREDGLYRHSPLCEAAWGRGNGFPALGLAMSLDYLPQEHAAYEKFREAADKLLMAVLKYADPMVHQVVDHPESYQEFSGTAMCAIAALTLERHQSKDGPKNEARARWVDDAWRELKWRTSEQGELIDVCESTGKQKTLDDYFKRKAIRGRDDRGGAFALLLATELMQRR